MFSTGGSILLVLLNNEEMVNINQDMYPVVELTIKETNTITVCIEIGKTEAIFLTTLMVYDLLLTFVFYF